MEISQKKLTKVAILGQLIKAHGGTITVASTPGQGTTFTIKLPVNAPNNGA